MGHLLGVGMWGQKQGEREREGGSSLRGQESPVGAGWLPEGSNTAWSWPKVTL